MRPDKLTLGLMGILVIAIVVMVVEQRQTNEELRNEIAGLHRSAGQLRPESKRGADDAMGSALAPGGENALPPAVQVELGRLREELKQLKSRTRDLERSASAGGAAPLNLMPASGWKNAGRDTPSAAAESLMWAADSGELDALANALVLDPAAREKAEAILARMPESTRAAYNTPEKLIALFFARDADVRAMQILGESKAGDDALVNLRLQKDDGKTKDEGYSFHRTADGWRMTVSGKAVDKMGKKLTDPPKK